MRIPRLSLPSTMLFALILTQASAAWGDRTSGTPWVEVQTARQLGADGSSLWFVAEDPLGRLFVGGIGLSVFDGQAWTTHQAMNSVAVRAIEFGKDGKHWIGGLNELGYFTETSVGRFEYHSLLLHLPEDERSVGDIWGVGLAGSHVYFIGREKLYHWDGQVLRTRSFPTSSRLFPLKLGGETWFQHRETGLYRVTEDGPKLEVAAQNLPEAALFGLGRDATGLVVVSNLGFFRPGNPAQHLFGSEHSASIVENRVSCHVQLPNGSHLVGTVNGGLFIVAPDGRILQQIDARTHPAARSIMGVYLDGHGMAWCATAGGILRVDPSGTVTLHTALTGLEGGALFLDAAGGRFLAGNPAGVFELGTGESQPARFARMEILKERYNAIRLTPSGVLLARHGGVDFLDATGVQTVYTLNARGVHRIVPSQRPPGRYLLSENDAVVELQSVPGDGFVLRRFEQISDFVSGLAEDARGNIWAGTVDHGAFVIDRVTGQTVHASDPATNQPLSGYVCLGGNGDNLLVFPAGRVMQVNPSTGKLQLLLQLPSIRPKLAAALPAAKSAVVLFSSQGSVGAVAGRQGLGRLTVGAGGRAEWHELDVPALDSIGSAEHLSLLMENGRPILWVGGSEGLLRLDYDAIPLLRAPPAPAVRFDTATSSPPLRAGGLDFSFAGHRLDFRIFTGDPNRAKDWRVQIRLGQSGGDDWSAPTSRRAYEFSNLSEGPYRFEVRTVNAAGLASEPTVFAFRILPPWYRSKGAYAGYVLALALGVGLTIRLRERRILAQNARLEAQVQERTVELVKANAAKDEFLAGVSHEIRNPMNGVIGISESLQTAGLDPESRHKFSLLRECAGHLSSLLEDLLDLSKMQAGVIEVEAVPFDLPALVGTVAAMAAADSEKYRIPVETAISPGVPQRLIGDPRRIRQILLNFVSNALKFSGRGQVEVTVWCQPAGADGRIEVIFAVADEGPGISPGEQARLFQRFERGAAARGGRVAGTGLGLALCKGYAEKMGGRIWLESEPGRGSCFYFSAPLGLAPTPAEPSPGADETAGPPTHPALVVDDQEYNRIVLVDLLARLGYAAQATGDGVDALALAGRYDFELVFLDYDLPGISGLEVSRGIRALPGGSARASIFATTAFNTPEKQQQCLDAGMNFFLGKPVTLERLRKALAAADATGGGPATPPPGSGFPSPVDGLANLRLLATKKQIPFAEEVALYLSELQVEIDDLVLAVQQRQGTGAARHAHRLCGRCSFIYERSLEQEMRRLEETAAKELWPEADRLCAELPALVAALRARLASSGPAAPPA